MNQFAIAVVLFIISFVFMGLEMAASRFLNPYFGSSVYTWGAIITIFLAGAGIGYWFGGIAADHEKRETFIQKIFQLCLVFLLLIPIFSKIVLPHLDGLPSNVGVLIGASVLFLIPNALLSAIIPSVVKSVLVQRLNGSRIGFTHMVSSIGSVLGTLVTTFLLLPLLHVLVLISILCILILLAYVLYTSKYRYSFISKSFWLIPICVVPLLSSQNPLQWGNTSIVASFQSPYHEIFVTEQNRYKGENGKFRFMQFSKQYYQGGMDLNDPGRDLFNYVQNMIKIVDAYHPDSNNVFMIGHGIGTLSSKMRLKGKQIEVSEIDPQVLEVSKKYFGYRGEDVVIGDGRKILASKTDNSLDVLMLDAYNSNSIPFHLITREFFEIGKRKLRSDGIVVMNLIGKTEGDALTESVNTTLSSVFTQVKVFVPKPLATGERGNLIVVAALRELPNLNISGVVENPVRKGELITDAQTRFAELN